MVYYENREWSGLMVGDRLVEIGRGWVSPMFGLC
jgi:hypothetical protein